MAENQKLHEVAVVMVPVPCQSHLNQLLQLAALISSHGGLPVHFLGSATHNRQAKHRSHGLNPSHLANIQFHDLPTPPIPSPEPDRNSAEKHPTHLIPVTIAYMELHRPIAAVVRQLLANTSRIVIVYDRLIDEAVKEAVLIPNVESYAFNCLSAFNMFTMLWEAMGKPFEVEREVDELPCVREILPAGLLDFLANRSDHFRQRNGDIHNTSRLIEAKYIDLLSREEIGGIKKQWAIRPTLMQNLTAIDEPKKHECLEWLDKQAPRSVIYVSFGTVVSLSNEEVRELAMGLEQSKKKFIWLLRVADRADIFTGEVGRIELPEGFLERVGEDGIVVRDWLPQMEILSHQSTGGFFSHCGWNSCYESLINGVPIAACPMHTDQPLNAVLLTEILGTAVAVRRWGDKKVEAVAVKRAVERLMGAAEGDGIRRRAAEVGGAMRKSMEEGGEFWTELDSFIAHIKTCK